MDGTRISLADQGHGDVYAIVDGHIAGTVFRGDEPIGVFQRDGDHSLQAHKNDGDMRMSDVLDLARVAVDRYKEAGQDAFEAALLELPWRVGRKLGRTVYAQRSDDPADSDVLVGFMETRGLADHVVALHNQQLAEDGS